MAPASQVDSLLLSVFIYLSISQFLTCSSFSGHWGCSYILAVVNKWCSEYESKDISLRSDFVSFQYIPRSGTAGSYVVLLAVFLRNFHTAVPCEICSVTSNSLWPHGLYSPWNSPDQNTGVGSLSLLQGIFPTQGSNPGLWHCRHILYQLSHKGSPRILEWVAYPFFSGSSQSRNRTGVSWQIIPYIYMYPFSPRLPSHPVCHITLSKLSFLCMVFLPSISRKWNSLFYMEESCDEVNGLGYNSVFRKW